ncbi:MAG TPA: hypothetical protein VFN23_00670 [Ktedonobacteraceae bacterium]|nr:hypothetical protein [Ktedonobacteraceae bacterium]
MHQTLQNLFNQVFSPGDCLVAGMIEASHHEYHTSHDVEGYAINQAGHLTCELPAEVRCAVIVTLQGNHYTIWKFGNSLNDRTPRHFWGPRIYWDEMIKVL